MRGLRSSGSDLRNTLEPKIPECNVISVKTHTHTHHVHELESLEQFAVPVLQSVSLVNDHTAPRHTAQLRTVRQDHLKRRDDGLELIGSLYHTTLTAGTNTHTHDMSMTVTSTTHSLH